MSITLDRSALEKLLHHAAFAARLVGHLDDGAHSALIRQLADHVDAIVHELTELLGNPHVRTATNAVETGTQGVAPMLTSIAGGAQ